MNDRRILVTIDDVGRAKPINDAVEQCIKAGTVDCLSVMASGSESEHAFRIIAASDMTVSAHLNCIEPPFLSHAEFPDSLAAWLLVGSKHAEEARTEWSMQIEKLLSNGVMVTRLDSHRHLHHMPALQEVILDLATQYGIRNIRAAHIPDRLRRPTGFVLNRYARSFSAKASDLGMRTTGCILGFGRSGSVDRDYLKSFEGKIPSGEVELIMHPSTEPVWSDSQPRELELMMSDWFRNWIEKQSG